MLVLRLLSQAKRLCKDLESSRAVMEGGSC